MYKTLIRSQINIDFQIMPVPIFLIVVDLELCYLIKCPLNSMFKIRIKLEGHLHYRNYHTDDPGGLVLSPESH